jgi:hypothetical protein
VGKLKRDVNQIVGYDIAADESGIYIAGEYFEDAGLRPYSCYS